MKTEENVYEDTTRAEETTAVSEEYASAVPSKFKDVDALVRAYGSLQAEFTRRSQKLKELEKKVENFEKGVQEGEHSGVEKLRKNAKLRKEETKRFDQFVAEATAVEQQEAFPPLQNPETDENQPSKLNTEEVLEEKNGHTMSETSASEATSARKTPVVANHGEGQASLYEQVSRNEEVRLKIIGEYLDSLSRKSAPLMTGGAGLMVTPPQRPRNISEAGNMALLYFKKPKNN